VISYAQNAEDVVLARALPTATGFYVDVGAGHPDIASVTKHFYELGWHGINIDPRADAIALLERERPRDINLRVAAGAHDGSAELYVVEGDPDLSTIDGADRDYLRDRGYAFKSETVLVQTLDGILEAHGVTAIDFLKIDVEGSESAVLEGIDLTRWAPKVVVVESVRPWSRERNDDQWRAILESQGYQEASFDGINLFFTRESEVALARALMPASALDTYETAAAVATREELDRLRDYIEKLEDEISDLKEWQAEVTDYVRTLQSELGHPIAVAPVIDLRPARSAPRVARRDRPPAVPRVAVVGTPHAGGGWITRVLADALDARPLPARHPADLEWAGLPDRFVIELHWQRSQYLEHTLRDHGVLVISPARHPLDVLLSILERAQQHDAFGNHWLPGVAGNEDALKGSTPTGTAFLDWATSPRADLLLSLTPEWWSTPATHRLRYEHLVADPHREVIALLARCEIEVPGDPHTVLARHPASPDEIPPDSWRGLLSSDAVDVLMAMHHDVMVSLGYDPDDRKLTSS